MREVEFFRESKEGDGESSSFFERETLDPISILLIERFRFVADMEDRRGGSEDFLKVYESSFDEEEGVDV